jgi:hypothetical protein
MATDPEFYAAVPSFMYLKDVAMQTWAELKTKVDCQKCHHEWKAMRGVVDAMFMKLRDLKAVNDPSLAAVTKWLESKKGYPIAKCVLYYRRSRTQGKIAKFEF